MLDSDGTKDATAVSVRTVAVVLLAAVTVTAAPLRNDFDKTWVHRRVVVRTALYSLVYKEQGVLDSIAVRRDGLTVITPSSGAYFQFEGRRNVGNVVDTKVEQIAPAVTVAYLRSKIIGEGTVQMIDPVMVARYDPGTVLIVRAVRVQMTDVRVELALPDDPQQELATTLTVHWPTPFSKSFVERSHVEQLMARYLSMPE